jgi:hypothetical protein
VLAFVLFIVAFIVRAIHNGLQVEGYVLWMVASLPAAYLAPVVGFVQTRRLAAQPG